MKATCGSGSPAMEPLDPPSRLGGKQLNGCGQGKPQPVPHSSNPYKPLDFGVYVRRRPFKQCRKPSPAKTSPAKASNKRHKRRKITYSYAKQTNLIVDDIIAVATSETQHIELPESLRPKSKYFRTPRSKIVKEIHPLEYFQTWDVAIGSSVQPCKDICVQIKVKGEVFPFDYVMAKPSATLWNIRQLLEKKHFANGRLTGRVFNFAGLTNLKATAVQKRILELEEEMADAYNDILMLRELEARTKKIDANYVFSSNEEFRLNEGTRREEEMEKCTRKMIKRLKKLEGVIPAFKKFPLLNTSLSEKWKDKTGAKDGSKPGAKSTGDRQQKSSPKTLPSAAYLSGCQLLKTRSRPKGGGEAQSHLRIATLEIQFNDPLCIRHDASDRDSQRLRRMCESNNMSDLDYFLKESPVARVDLTNRQDEMGMTILHILAERRDVELTKTILGLDGNPYLRDWRGRTALHYAVQKGSKEIVALYLEWDKAIRYECPLNNVERVEIRRHLLGREPKTLTIQRPPHLPPLHAVEDYNDTTALHLALHLGFLEIAVLLIQRGGYNLDRRDKIYGYSIRRLFAMKMSPVLATQTGDLATLDLWIDHLEVDINKVGSLINLPLLAQAVMHRNQASVDHLLKRQANPNVDCPSQPLPCLVARCMHDRIFLSVYNHESTLKRIFFEQRDANGNNAFHIALEKGFHGMAARLLNCRVLKLSDFSMANVYGQTCLHIAVMTGNSGAIERILDRSEARPEFVNQQNADGDTPLGKAIKLGTPYIVSQLLACPAVSPDLPCSAGRSPLFIATCLNTPESRNPKAIKDYFPYPKHNNFIPIPGSPADPPPPGALEPMSPLSQKDTPPSPVKRGLAPLPGLYRLDSLSPTPIPSRLGTPDNNIKISTLQTITKSSYAQSKTVFGFEKGHIEMEREQMQATLTMAIAHGDGALIVQSRPTTAEDAAKVQKMELQELNDQRPQATKMQINLSVLLINAGANINYGGDVLKWDSPLHQACRNRDTHLCAQFLANGADPLLRVKGRTPLGLACESGIIPLMTAILSNVCVSLHSPSILSSILHESEGALCKAHDATLYVLKKTCIDVRLHGYWYVHYACRYSNLELIHTLIALGAPCCPPSRTNPMNAISSPLATPLFNATPRAKTTASALQELLTSIHAQCFNPDLNQEQKEDAMASLAQTEDLCHMLLSHGAVQGDNPSTEPTSFEQEKQERIKNMRSQKVFQGVKNASNGSYALKTPSFGRPRTPEKDEVSVESSLILACRCGMWDLANLLVMRHKADVNVIDTKNKRTPLHYGTISMFGPFVRVLVTATNCEINPIDKLGFTPLMYAVKLGHVHLTALLLVAGGLGYNLNNKYSPLCLFSWNRIRSQPAAPSASSIRSRYKPPPVPFKRQIQGGKIQEIAESDTSRTEQPLIVGDSPQEQRFGKRRPPALEASLSEDKYVGYRALKSQTTLFGFQLKQKKEVEPEVEDEDSDDLTDSEEEGKSKEDQPRLSSSNDEKEYELPFEVVANRICMDMVKYCEEIDAAFSPYNYSVEDPCPDAPLPFGTHSKQDFTKMKSKSKSIVVEVLSRPPFSVPISTYLMLHHATLKQNPQAVAELLAAGCEVNLRAPMPLSELKDGVSMWASQSYGSSSAFSGSGSMFGGTLTPDENPVLGPNSHPPVPADVLYPPGATPLCVAAMLGNALIVTQLLNAEANPNVPTVTGETALGLALRHGHKEVASILLNAGAHPNEGVNRYGGVPIHYTPLSSNKTLQLYIKNISPLTSFLPQVASQEDIPFIEFLIDKGCSFYLNELEPPCLMEYANDPEEDRACPISALHILLAASERVCHKDFAQFALNNTLTGVVNVQTSGNSDVATARQAIGLLILQNYKSDPNAKDLGINLQDMLGRTVLELAIRSRMTQLAMALIKHGASFTHHSSLPIARFHGSPSITKSAVSKQKTLRKLSILDGLLVFHAVAISWPLKKALEFMLQGIQHNGPNFLLELDISGTSLLHVCLRRGKFQFTKALLKELDGVPLRREMVNCIDSRDRTPLMEAAKTGQAEVVEILLSIGALETLRATTANGANALHLATMSGSLPCAKLLIEHGLNPFDVMATKCTMFTGMTLTWSCLTLAVYYGHTELALYLMRTESEKAMEAQVPETQETLLHLAAYRGLTDVVERALNIFPASRCNATNFYGDSALDLALAFHPESHDVIKLLQNFKGMPRRSDSVNVEFPRYLKSALKHTGFIYQYGGWDNVKKLYLTSEDEETDLMKISIDAARIGNDKTLVKILEKGKNDYRRMLITGLPSMEEFMQIYRQLAEMGGLGPGDTSTVVSNSASVQGSMKENETFSSSFGMEMSTKSLEMSTTTASTTHKDHAARTEFKDLLLRRLVTVLSHYGYLESISTSAQKHLWDRTALVLWRTDEACDKFLDTGRGVCLFPSQFPINARRCDPLGPAFTITEPGKPTLVHEMALTQCRQAISYLLKSNTDRVSGILRLDVYNVFKHKEERGMTPPHISCALGDLPTVVEMLKHSVDFNVRDYTGMTPLQYIASPLKMLVLGEVLKKDMKVVTMNDWDNQERDRLPKEPSDAHQAWWSATFPFSWDFQEPKKYHTGWKLSDGDVKALIWHALENEAGPNGINITHITRGVLMMSVEALTTHVNDQFEELLDQARSYLTQIMNDFVTEIEPMGQDQDQTKNVETLDPRDLAAMAISHLDNNLVITADVEGIESMAPNVLWHSRQHARFGIAGGAFGRELADTFHFLTKSTGAYGIFCLLHLTRIQVRFVEFPAQVYVEVVELGHKEYGIEIACHAHADWLEVPSIVEAVDTFFSISKVNRMSHLCLAYKSLHRHLTDSEDEWDIQQVGLFIEHGGIAVARDIHKASMRELSQKSTLVHGIELEGSFGLKAPADLLRTFGQKSSKIGTSKQANSDASTPNATSSATPSSAPAPSLREMASGKKSKAQEFIALLTMSNDACYYASQLRNSPLREDIEPLIDKIQPQMNCPPLTKTGNEDNLGMHASEILENLDAIGFIPLSLDIVFVVNGEHFLPEDLTFQDAPPIPKPGNHAVLRLTMDPKNGAKVLQSDWIDPEAINWNAMSRRWGIPISTGKWKLKPKIKSPKKPPLNHSSPISHMASLLNEVINSYYDLTSKRQALAPESSKPLQEPKKTLAEQKKKTLNKDLLWKIFDANHDVSMFARMMRLSKSIYNIIGPGGLFIEAVERCRAACESKLSLSDEERESFEKEMAVQIPIILRLLKYMHRESEKYRFLLQTTVDSDST